MLRTVRSLAKRVLERSAVATGACAVALRRRSPAAVVLAYHNIVPHGEPAGGDAPLHLPQRRFADQLDRLLESHVVVGLDVLLASDRDDDDRPRAVITFDDAYRGTMSAGIEELHLRGLPATVFVPPGLLGTDGFWWDRLAPGDGRPLDASFRRHALLDLAGRHDDVMAAADVEGVRARQLPEHMWTATADDLAAAVGMGVTYGSHTWSHPNLARLPAEEIEREVGRGHEWLRTRPGFIDWFAYPYGLYGPHARSIASRSASGAVLIEGGLARVRGQWTGTSELFPRISVPSALTPDGLSLRLAGLR